MSTRPDPTSRGHSLGQGHRTAQRRHAFRARRLLRAAALPAGFLCVLMSGGYGPQDALDSAGPQAHRIETLWWVFVWVCVVVYAVVLLFLFLPMVLHRSGRRGVGAGADPAADRPETRSDPATDRLKTTMVGGAVGLTALVLFVLLVGDVVTGRGIHSLPDPNPLTIKLTAHQWWWEVRYEDAEPYKIVSGANEIHIPTGRPVKFELSSNDVIHSFWVPNLHGKKDMVPGHPVSTWFQADRAGTYFGQCAEFCGHQHANMRLAVIAHSPQNFDEWLRFQRQLPSQPTTEGQKKGQQVFLASSCILCHTVQGTNAGARLGPDLTHVGSRWALAAGAIPNTTGHLAGWILDPQKIKPGAHMPPNELRPQDLRALLEYLESLK